MIHTKAIFKTLLLILISVVLYSCQVKEVEVSDIESFRIVNIDDKYVTIDLAAKIKNPNNFSFTISKVDLDASFNGVSLGKINKVQDVRIKKNSNELQHLVFKIELKQITKGSLLFLSTLLTGKAKIKVKGFIKVTKFPFTKKIEVDYNKSTKFQK